jgi:predicted enzyme related to lactoylglutathione lyase
MTLPDATVPPHWQPNAAVDDPDATTAKAEELGGAVLMDPMDVPKVGASPSSAIRKAPRSGYQA